MTTTRTIEWTPSGGMPAKTDSAQSRRPQTYWSIKRTCWTSQMKSFRRLWSPKRPSFSKLSGPLEACCFRGYLTTISRRSTSLHLSLLNHLLRMHTATSWGLTKKEIDYYLKKFQTFGDHASSRLHCLLCHIYTFLRDCCDKSWRVAELDQFKLEGLYSKMEQISAASSVTVAEEGKQERCALNAKPGSTV